MRPPTMTRRRRLSRLQGALCARAATGIVALCCVVALPASVAAAIDLSASILNINGSLTTETGATVVVAAPVGPFIADFDLDGILEADTNGNGLDRWDPELRDYSAPADGTRELPPDSVLTTAGALFEFTTFEIPDDVFVEVTGPLDVGVDGPVVLNGVLRAADDVTIAATGAISSAGILRVAGNVTLRTATAGSVTDGLLAGGCDAPLTQKVPFPMFTLFGLLLLVLAITGSVALTMRYRRDVLLAERPSSERRR